MALSRTTPAVSTPAGAWAIDGEVFLRLFSSIVAALAVAVLVHSSAAPTTRTHLAVASAYSASSSGPLNGCDGSRLHDPDLSVATQLVPCGTRIEICYRGRCVTATRRDSGPYVGGRQLDLNVGVVRALGFPTALAFGVRTVSWRRA